MQIDQPAANLFFFSLQKHKRFTIFVDFTKKISNLKCMQLNGLFLQNGQKQPIFRIFEESSCLPSFFNLQEEASMKL